MKYKVKEQLRVVNFLINNVKKESKYEYCFTTKRDNEKTAEMGSTQSFYDKGNIDNRINELSNELKKLEKLLS